MSTFKDRIKELRQKNNYTLKELGEKIGYSESTISMYESGKRQPKKAEDYIKIAKFFGVSMDYLMGKTDIRNAYVEEENKPRLTRRDEKDIKKVIEETKEHLENAEGLMFDGDPATPEAIESILKAMEMGMALAKQKNKEKYTPKKYKKNK